MRQGKKKQEEDDDRDEKEDRKGFLGFPINQSSPTSTPIRYPPPQLETTRPPPPTNGERRPRGRPPKNWPWGTVKDGTQVGRPPKARPAEEDDDEDDEDEDEERTERGKSTSSVSGPSSFFSLDRQVDPTSLLSLDIGRHPTTTPTRRGRPPRKKRGPKPRLTEESGEGLAQFPAVSRLNESPSVRNSCFSESSDEEEDDEDEDDEERRACSPPILTKPAIGLKCKVRYC